MWIDRATVADNLRGSGCDLTGGTASNSNAKGGLYIQIENDRDRDV
jgi:hypothetical protein